MQTTEWSSSALGANSSWRRRSEYVYPVLAPLHVGPTEKDTNMNNDRPRKGRGGTPTPVHEVKRLRESHEALRRRVGRLEDLVDSGPPNYTKLVGKAVKVLTPRGAKAVGTLIRIGKYNVDLKLSTPFSPNGGPPEFQEGEVITLSKGDISIIGESANG